MNLEINKVYSGKVRNIQPYGAFIEISNPENKDDKVTGMVHISEISNDYVNKIEDFLHSGQEVNVIVLGENNGKYSFSIKKASNNIKSNNSTTQNNVEEKPYKQSYKKEKSLFNSNTTKKEENTDNSFEAMMSRFKKISEDKISDMNRNRDRNNRSYRSK